MRAIVTLAAALVALPASCHAATDGCAPPACGKPSCPKVCRIVCEMKKIEKTVWVVECEEFCLPNPGCGGPACGCPVGCDPSGGCGKPCGPPPRCGPVRCRKKLVKKTITVEVPVYKCMVVACGSGGCAAEPDAPVKEDNAKQASLPPVAPMREMGFPERIAAIRGSVPDTRSGTAESRH